MVKPVAVDQLTGFVSVRILVCFATNVQNLANKLVGSTKSQEYGKQDQT
jgi:hypothetical protein